MFNKPSVVEMMTSTPRTNICNTGSGPKNQCNTGSGGTSTQANQCMDGSGYGKNTCKNGSR
mgnify:CR=1 FL=1